MHENTPKPRQWPPVTIEELVDEDVLATQQPEHCAGFRARSRIPWGWIIPANELFDDFPESRMEELHKRAEKVSGIENTEPISPDTGSTVNANIPTEMPKYQPPPPMKEAQQAHTDIKKAINNEKKTSSWKVLQALEQMRMLLYCYTGGMHTWMAASLHVAKQHEQAEYRARQLRAWTRAFIADRCARPYSNMGTWNISLLDKNTAFKTDLTTHLQSVGKYTRAQDIVDFMADPMNQLRYGFYEPIALCTAQVWMGKLGYRWTKGPRGQYVDGHERSDVVEYRNKVFLPAMENSEPRIALWSKDGTDIPVLDYEPRPLEQRIVLWYHDESIFYAHDRRDTRWVHEDEKAVPLPKGEGVSLMVSDFVSAEYGWLQSPDGKESARVLLKPGKNREGYFTNEDVIKQAEEAMDILQRFYPNEQHILIYDNATTHLKRPPDAPSARQMSLKPTKSGSVFGVTIADVDEVTGNPVHGRDGKVLKKKVKMADARFADGTPQSLYFPHGHPQAGVFKGMAVILQERGINTAGLRAQCGRNFDCKPPALSCCVRRILYNQPDFRDVESLLEKTCRKRGFQVLFLPKFHCELNPIEQCWGYAKRVYREYPLSSKEEDLERNTLNALASIPLATIRRFFTRTRRFMEIYRLGLTGKQAAWAVKMYRGHRAVPFDMLEELDFVGI